MGHENKDMSGKNTQNCVWIGIGVDISEGTELYQGVVKMNSLLIGKYGAEGGFAGSEHPHLNLYDLSVPRENLKAIVERVKEVVSTQKNFAVKIGAIRRFSFGLFFLEINNNSGLKKLHRKIVEEVVKLRGECIDKDYLAPYRKYTKRQKELLIKYGNPYVLDQFQPHITIGHVRNTKNNLMAIQEELNRLIPMTELRVDNVHVVAENKKSKKTLGKFSLMPAVGY